MKTQDISYSLPRNITAGCFWVILRFFINIVQRNLVINFIQNICSLYGIYNEVSLYVYLKKSKNPKATCGFILGENCRKFHEYLKNATDLSIPVPKGVAIVRFNQGLESESESFCFYFWDLNWYRNHFLRSLKIGIGIVFGKHWESDFFFFSNKIAEHWCRGSYKWMSIFHFFFCWQSIEKCVFFLIEITNKFEIC